jgi:hypothetical protein
MLWHKTIGAGGLVGGGAGTTGFLTELGGFDRGNTSRLTIDYPLDIQAGDLLLIDGFYLANRTADNISGWDSTYNTPYTPAFFKTATGTESGDVDITWSKAANAAAYMVRIRALNGNTPYITGRLDGNSNNFTLAPPGTLGNGNDYNILSLFRASTYTYSITSPTPTAQLFDDSSRFTAWHWDDNTANVVVNTNGTNTSYRFFSINA